VKGILLTALLSMDASCPVWAQPITCPRLGSGGLIAGDFGGSQIG
jgi:hypothetical protein